MIARSHRKLIIWQRAVALASHVYAMTTGPESAQHPLFDQMRHSALAVATRIGDGAGRGTRLEYLRFLEAARGAVAELEAQVFVALELHIVPAHAGLPQEIGELRALLTAQMLRLREFRERAASFELPASISMANFNSGPPSSR